MSFFDCMEEAKKDTEYASRARAAQEHWTALRDEYVELGHTRETAEFMAKEDLSAAWKKSTAAKQHTYFAQLADARKAQAQVANSDAPADIPRRALEYAENSANQIDNVWSVRAALKRRFHFMLGDFMREFRAKNPLLGTRNKAGQLEIIKELNGEKSGNLAAEGLAHSVRRTFAEMKRMFNEAGGHIGTLEGYDLPHKHNARSLRKAKFDKWYNDVNENIAWHKIEDHMTGRPFADEPGAQPPDIVKRRFLNEIYRNIVTDGRSKTDAQYGGHTGNALHNRHSQHRILHFKDAESWVNYNKVYGSNDIYGTIMAHVETMSRDIALMRTLGPNPKMGLDYRKQLAARKVDATTDGAEGNEIMNEDVSDSMLRIITGESSVPKTRNQEMWARFFSTARHAVTAAFLDRAMLASLSDVGSMRMAAHTIGANPENVLSRGVDLMASQMSRDDALRAGWVADSWSDAGAAMSRFQNEVPPAEWAERLSSAVMRYQGLSGWTDNMRIGFQMEMAGLFAGNAGRKIKDIDAPLRAILERRGVTDEDWALFTQDLFVAGNGATFAAPAYWRENTSLDAAKADRIFEKIQSIVEEQTEYAVPTMNLQTRAYVDGRFPPGSLMGESIKSGLMFKSFPMTFSANQYRRIAALPNTQARIGYGLNLVAGMLPLGALSLQLAHISSGRDPEDMTTPSFWGRALLKSGGFGVLGDIVAIGESSWGGEYGSYLTGPMPQVALDVWKLTIGNMVEIASGDDTNFAQEFARAGSRYMPGAQLPFLGPAVDRLLWDQVQLVLDPESITAMNRASRVRENRTGNRYFWQPGNATPDRAPDLGGIFGR